MTAPRDRAAAWSAYTTLWPRSLPNPATGVVR